MTRSKCLKGGCQHCGGHLEFLAETIGLVVPCPHCGRETELLLAVPAEESAVPRRAIIWTGIAMLVLGLGLAGALVALKRARNWAVRQKPQAGAVAMAESPSNVQVQVPLPVTESPSPDEFSISPVAIEKAAGTTLIYAVGTVTNVSKRQRFGVKVELELSDADGQKVGTATDYRQVLEPSAQWQFKALVVDSKAKSAKITSIKEDQ